MRWMCRSFDRRHRLTVGGSCTGYIANASPEGSVVRFSPATAGLFFGWLMTRRRRHQHSCAWAASVAHPNVQSASALAGQVGAGLRMATSASTATAGVNAWMSSNCATHDAREHGITRAWRTQAARRLTRGPLGAWCAADHRLRPRHLAHSERCTTVLLSAEGARRPREATRRAMPQCRRAESRVSPALPISLAQAAVLIRGIRNRQRGGGDSG